MKISNEFKIGFWTIIAILVLVFGIQYLKGINSLRRGQFYYVVSNNVEGLANSGPVKVNGFQVGLVRSMTYDKASGNIVVEVNLEESSLKIPTDSHASIQTDLLGTSYVVITLGKANTYLQSRDTIAGGEKTAGLLDGATPIIASVNDIMPKRQRHPQPSAATLQHQRAARRIRDSSSRRRRDDDLQGSRKPLRRQTRRKKTLQQV